MLGRAGRRFCLHRMLSMDAEFTKQSCQRKKFLIIVPPSPTSPSPNFSCYFSPFILLIQATRLENSNLNQSVKNEMNRKKLKKKLKQLTRKQDRTESSTMKYKEASYVRTWTEVPDKQHREWKSVNIRTSFSPCPRINLDVSTPVISA